MQFPKRRYIDSSREVDTVNRKETLLSWLAGDLPGEILPGQSLVELTGDRQIFIENHRGVIAYTREHMGIRLSFGELHICGQCLELARMNREHLVITGVIQSLELRRRCL